MDSYASSVQEQAAQDHLLVTAGEVMKSIQLYHRRTSTLMRAQKKDLHSMIAMMSDTIVKIGGANEGTAARLQDIEKQLVGVSAVDDVQILKARLADCLQNVRTEIESHRSQSAATIEALQSQLDQAGEQPEQFQARDEVTDLPNFAAAEAALAIAAREPARHFVAIFVVNRVQLINARYGAAIGDQALNVARNHLAASLSGMLFRWRGPSFLSLLQHPGHVEQIRAELQRIASCKLEKNVEFGSRSVLLPITLAWTVFPMLTSARLIAQKADSFVAAQLPTE
jgi:GGDEF domain-containing protein